MMKKQQVLALIILLAIGNGMHAALPKEEHWIRYKNPFDSQFDDSDVVLRGVSFQQYINEKDQYYSTLLTEAIQANKIKNVKRLIEFGVNVNEQTMFYGTHLLSAICQNKSEIAQLLINGGADLNKQDSFGRTVLHWAVEIDSYELVKILVAAGADTTIVDSDGRKAIQFAIDRSIRTMLQNESLKRSRDFNDTNSGCSNSKKRNI